MTSNDNKFLKSMRIEPVAEGIFNDFHREEKERMVAAFTSERDELIGYIEHLKRSRHRLRVVLDGRTAKMKYRIDVLYLALFACALVISYLAVKG